MCLTIPKKVLEIRENEVVVENHLGDRQIMKTLIELTIGDFVLSKQNVIIQKMDKQDAAEILELIKR